MIDRVATAVARHPLGIATAILCLLVLLTLAGACDEAPAPEQVFVATPSHCMVEIRPAEAPTIRLDLRVGESRVVDLAATSVEVAVVPPYSAVTP